MIWLTFFLFAAMVVTFLLIGNFLLFSHLILPYFQSIKDIDRRGPSLPCNNIDDFDWVHVWVERIDAFNVLMLAQSFLSLSILACPLPCICQHLGPWNWTLIMESRSASKRLQAWIMKAHTCRVSVFSDTLHNIPCALLRRSTEASLKTLQNAMSSWLLVPP